MVAALRTLRYNYHWITLAILDLGDMNHKCVSKQSLVTSYSVSIYSPPLSGVARLRSPPDLPPWLGVSTDVSDQTV